MNSSEEASSGNQTKAPRVIVSFSGYEPPFDPAPLVRRMLDSVPKSYLVGLDAVVLSNASGLSGKRRNSRVKSRKRRTSLAAVSGLYHPASRGNPAWIEIFLDNTVRGWEKTLWVRVPFFRESQLSDVLFHEIGHHIHRTVRPEYREKEDVADVWKVRLQRSYHQQRFAWMRIVFRLVRPLFGSYLERQKEKLELKMLNHGQISQAEYRESQAKKRPGDSSAAR